MRTRVKELRKQKNISQTTLATYVGCSQNTISKIEKGECDPKVSLVIEIADYFGVSIDYVLGNSEVKYSYESMSRYGKTSDMYIHYLAKIEKMTPAHRKLVNDLIDGLSEDEENANRK
ncbi:MAG: XRE family transcriptional regulator [Clostridia bacterium]|nr:XRE family transcriptional regulator [Clostridia bacterium]NCC44233.1 XRE family transcriptional regulator [Clostridia bacterium]